MLWFRTAINGYFIEIFDKGLPNKHLKFKLCGRAKYANDGIHLNRLANFGRLRNIKKVILSDSSMTYSEKSWKNSSQIKAHCTIV